MESSILITQPDEQNNFGGQVEAAGSGGSFLNPINHQSIISANQNSDAPFKSISLKESKKTAQEKQQFATMRLENSQVFKEAIKKKTLKERSPNIHR